jgi:CubicO group peptidase (beta-lactamase class C family)
MTNMSAYRKYSFHIVAWLCLFAIHFSAQPGFCTLGPYAPESSDAFSFSPFTPESDPLDDTWQSPLPSPASSETPSVPAAPPSSETQPVPAAPGTSALLLRRAAQDRLIYGGVVVIGNHNGILSVTSRGRVDGSRGGPLLDEHAMFDLASLTKVVATAPAVMKLLDQGKISLSDPISRWFPEFRGSRHSITILELLTHTSGLSDRHLLPHQSIHGVALRAAKTQERYAPGNHFQYADINFILLAELVHRVSGKPLDVFCREELYAPLGMKRTMFRPPRAVFGDLAPSTDFAKGMPQDTDARRLGGVAGHAGLFSSGEDLSRYARLMLGGGSLEGRRILSEETVAKMTAAHPCGGGEIERGLGWDIDSPFSAPKGTLFSEKSFGHTGYSGSSIWIDPAEDLFVIILTNRRDFHHTASFNQFRRDVSTIAAAQFGEQGTNPSAGFMQKAEAEILRITARCLLPGNRVSGIFAQRRYANDRFHGHWNMTSSRKHGQMMSMKRTGNAGHGRSKKRHRSRRQA